MRYRKKPEKSDFYGIFLIHIKGLSRFTEKLYFRIQKYFDSGLWGSWE